VRRHGAIAGSLEIPMQHFVRTVERFFLESHESGVSEPAVSHEQLTRIVSATLFAAIPRADPLEAEDEGDSQQ
jgi:hypothetical protein